MELTEIEKEFLTHVLKNVIPNVSVPLRDAKNVEAVVASLLQKVEELKPE